MRYTLFQTLAAPPGSGRQLRVVVASLVPTNRARRLGVRKRVAGSLQPVPGGGPCRILRYHTAAGPLNGLAGDIVLGIQVDNATAVVWPLGLSIRDPRNRHALLGSRSSSYGCTLSLLGRGTSAARHLHLPIVANGDDS
ncbi:hypothetical protein EXIGLDRAFT_345739 [Exidia glandulosa HHB12029]|uniref:Uncharacterized protein n=1 Tax=Exidia glandulosa HHB12029 TaxID=1314781 RepID=A0A165CGU1_EXIGL|nr:hypothetical protein EXIGLDRAFT_345739 [Exidia glandulosa HHB12029]